jgi:prohibitin 2
MSGAGARTLGRLLAERARAAGVAYGGGGRGGGANGGPGGVPPNLGRILGGSGAIVALVVGGLVVNASLFNGALELSPVLYRTPS